MLGIKDKNLRHRLREGVLILSLAGAFFLVVSLLTYHSSDPHWFRSSHHHSILNSGGLIGAWFADLFFYMFGYLAYLFPAITGFAGWLAFQGRYEEEIENYHLVILRTIGFILILLGGCSLTSLLFHSRSMPVSSGGLLGDTLVLALISIFNFMGTVVLLGALLLAGFTLCTGISWLDVLDKLGKFSLKSLESIQGLKEYFESYWHERRAVKKEKSSVKELQKITPKKKSISPKSITIEKTTPKVEPSVRAVKEKQVPLFDDETTEGPLPPLSLLDPPEKPQGQAYSNEFLETRAREVEARLADFGIDVQVVAVHPGPVVTRFELQLAPGLKVSKISTLAKDLARSLSVVSVRVVEVIPGKSFVGLELPNEHREVVRLSEVLTSQQYDQARSSLSLALGKDIAGHPVIVDLAKMPHLLVAGTTGSGKSVGLNAMLLSILYKATPDEVRMIMIDPKMLELSIYEGIPHLLAPVVTDMKEAASALRWCVAEMDRRYRLMASLGVRNLSGYNTKVTEAKKKGTPLVDPFWQPQQSEKPEELTSLPYIMVLVDEFADMMMVVGKKVEDLIARIAQKARAAGIHMILATQRPSVDVITGLIKANIPTRIAFQVSSKIDARTILDQAGAEQLLGNGDMLYLAPGTGIPVRVHGAFVADHEVHRVVNDWKKRGTPEYKQDILECSYGEEAEGISGTSEQEGEADPLYDQAVQIVVTSRRASISNIQRRLKIGYNRAARLVEDMEKAGIVSTMESNGSREVLAPEPME